jgi:hypothetical protein
LPQLIAQPSLAGVAAYEMYLGPSDSPPFRWPASMYGKLAQKAFRNEQTWTKANVCPSCENPVKGGKALEICDCEGHMVMLPEMVQIGVTDEFLDASRTMTHTTTKRIFSAMFNSRWLIDMKNMPIDIEVPLHR